MVKSEVIFQTGHSDFASHVGTKFRYKIRSICLALQNTWKLLFLKWKAGFWIGHLHNFVYLKLIEIQMWFLKCHLKCIRNKNNKIHPSLQNNKNKGINLEFADLNAINASRKLSTNRLHLTYLYGHINNLW